MAVHERQKYTLGFIKSETGHVLFLNRQKDPWMGRWNGVGGKLDAGETPHECMVRETHEETGLTIPTFEDRGVMKWVRDGQNLGGVHIFTASVSKEVMDNYTTPRVHCHEGVLDWKSLEWLLDERNTGIVDNVKIMLREVFSAGPSSLWVSSYEGNRLLSCTYDSA